MSKIVICCDGTWNTPDEQDGGVPVPTNVVRLFNAVAETDPAGNPQRKYYHPGVGTNGSWWDKAIDGGTGRGLDRNIMSAYRELCEQYRAGDQIFLFGFSRGAYTVRSLAGLIDRCGLLDASGQSEPQIWERIERLFQRGYRGKSETRTDWQALGWSFRNEPGASIPIRFLGVWDTVGALGIPDDMALLNLLDKRHDHTFHNTDLGPSIQTARHAIALDEVRASFQPTLWTAGQGQDARQVWFPGVHSDVGGGYRETGLSNGALLWMIEEANGCGLAFDGAMKEQIEANHLDVLHDSCKGAFALLPSQPRNAPALESGAEQVHASALDRQAKPPIGQAPYRRTRTLTPPAPLRLEIFAAHPWNETGLWLNAGVSYSFTATGEWLDSSIKCGPGGTSDGNFQPGELAHVLGSALGKVEGWFKKLSGNPSADFRFTKRHETMPWFSLVGAIANGGGADAKGHLEPHETFQIGAGCTYTPRKSGYLYAYANDAWNCYGNNRGKVQLLVT